MRRLSGLLYLDNKMVGDIKEKIKKNLSKISSSEVSLNIKEIKKPELNAYLVAENIAQQLEKRVMYRRAVKRVLGNATRLGALGIKIMVSGRLNGAEIARSEWYREGRVPLHTFRADVDYSSFRANTQHGVIGIKFGFSKVKSLTIIKAL